jgi:hypothetical protein
MYGTAANEAKAGAAIKPGHIVMIGSADGLAVVNTVVATPMGVEVAIEDDFQGKTTADAYAATDRVRTRVLNAGDRFYARSAATFTCAIGTLLQTATGGRVEKYAAGVPMFKALEALTSAAADTQVLCEVL